MSYWSILDPTQKCAHGQSARQIQTAEQSGQESATASWVWQIQFRRWFSPLLLLHASHLYDNLKCFIRIRRVWFVQLRLARSSSPIFGKFAMGVLPIHTCGGYRNIVIVNVTSPNQPGLNYQLHPVYESVPFGPVVHLGNPQPYAG